MVNQFIKIQTNLCHDEPDFKTAFQAQLGANLGMVQFFLLPDTMMLLKVGKPRKV